MQQMLIGAIWQKLLFTAVVAEGGRITMQASLSKREALQILDFISKEIARSQKPAFQVSIHMGEETSFCISAQQ